MSHARPSTQHGAMLQSIKIAKAKEARASVIAGTQSGHGLDSSSSPATTPRKEKHKKLSEKGKTKLSEHRAHEFLQAEQNRLEQAYAEAHPELIDANGEIEMPSVNDLFGDGLAGDVRLAQQIIAERKTIANEEMVRKLAKLQRKHNTMQNAMTKGNKVAAGYDRDEIDLRVVQKELKKNREKAKTAVIVLEEAIPLIRNATNAAAVGMKALLAYLSQESILREFSQTDIRYLRASLDAELERRNSPINFRVEILWRFACIIHEFKKGDREQNLRLAQHVYEKLLERCDPETHPFQYAGLQNTLELCQIEMERVTGYKIINRANRDVSGEKTRGA
jgi:hypothetical protein